MKKPKTIDEYLSSVGVEQRRLLEDLRRKIHQSVPGVEECISYGMPAFRLSGRVIAGFQATSRGCSYYPFSGSTLAATLGEWKGTRGSLHFQMPLPAALVRKLLKARIAEG